MNDHKIIVNYRNGNTEEFEGAIISALNRDFVYIDKDDGDDKPVKISNIKAIRREEADEDTYKAAVKCDNCYKEDVIELPMGKRVHEVECPNCGVADLWSRERPQTVGGGSDE